MRSMKRHANLENYWPSGGFAVCSGGFGGVMEGRFRARRKKREAGKTYGRDPRNFFKRKANAWGGHGSADGHLGRTAV